jgi:non-specific serine/threonine protein kinase
LLVLDNCEHLIDACAQLATDLLRACPHLRLLSSSREPLGVAGETIFRVPALRVPDLEQMPTHDQLTEFEAINLFAERARAVQPAFAVTNTNAAALAQICVQLDGIPLAIELAAARVPALMPAQIATRLDDRFRLLTGGSRMALPRHQTLRALIDWSYDLLAGEERVLLRRLAVFAGGWTLEAAEAVCAFEVEHEEPKKEEDDPALFDSRFSILDLLARLVEKSLVQVDERGGAARYRMLETIRQYALEKLAQSGEAEQIRRQHADYYLTIGEGQFFGRLSEWLPRAAAEYNNLRAAYEWNQTPAGDPDQALRLAPSLCALGYSLGLMSEAQAMLERLLHNPRRTGTVLAEARFHTALGNLLGEMGYFVESRSHLESGLTLFRQLGDASLCAYIMQRLGWLAREQGDARTAWARTEEARALFLKVSDIARAATIYTTQAEIAILEENPALAAALLDQRRAQRRDIDNDIDIAWDLNHLGHAAQLRGDFARAAEIHVESLTKFLGLHKHHVGVFWAYQSLGEAAMGQGDIRSARGWLARGLALGRQAHDQPTVAWCLAGLGSAAALGGAPERAARLWGAAERLRMALGCRPAPATRATYERALASARSELGEVAFALAWDAGQELSLEAAIAEALSDCDVKGQ